MKRYRNALGLRLWKDQRHGPPPAAFDYDNEEVLPKGRAFLVLESGSSSWHRILSGTQAGWVFVSFQGALKEWEIEES
jgi:hypothetical protein